MPTGRLDVTVLRAGYLKDTTYLIGSQNPYVVIKLRDQKKKSEPDWDGGINPVWNFRTTLNVLPDDVECVILIENKPWSMAPRRLIGKATIDLARDLVNTEGGKHMHLDVFTDERKRGWVEVTLTFRQNPRYTWSPKTATTHQSLERVLAQQEKMTGRGPTPSGSQGSLACASTAGPSMASTTGRREAQNGVTGGSVSSEARYPALHSAQWPNTGSAASVEEAAAHRTRYPEVRFRSAPPGSRPRPQPIASEPASQEPRYPVVQYGHLPHRPTRSR
mmetsp:Transcript_1022/g.3591  ORF Transcript_1022/g.3591 Transcript_1022/m.3591 type:complete len:276 (+) Transcript_1022:66-893(+)